MTRLISAAVVILISVYAFFNISRQDNILDVTTQPTGSLPTETTTLSTDTSSTADLIKQLFIDKYGWPLDKIDLSIKTDTGTFASGGVRNTDEMGGAMWFAANKEGGWHLVFDGNGTITCDALSGYPDYPTSIIPDCYDPSTGQMVNR